ncbi:metallo-beta-lactamase superfamily protein [Geothermobacter ehrlichii]|uniref:Metallo-beta-lactamase superfamily protein n=1 Tax=Geothermobacter ehrlichii TaxID=213224 RepID=A0A5D3WGC1_9BACT|nr:MBL fold metallo-hydrolase [Geothermobacter ehrlichii]TYO96339.1 metallo-beta-lactamase superfamily protein [Geothermobacter ehrlichii]
MRLLLVLLALSLPVTSLAAPVATPQLTGPTFTATRLTDNVFALTLSPGSRATSNALLVVGDRYAVVAGAHMTRETIDALVARTAAITPLPIRYFVLTHHHRGYTHIDFDFPPDAEVIMSWQTWQALAGETRAISFPVLFFRDGLTLRIGGRNLVLTNIGPAHTDGDVIAYLPESKLLFTSDLFYAGGVGYMGDGHMQDWVLALEFLQSLRAERIIPGQGPVSRPEDLVEYTRFFRDFLTEIIAHLERGDSLKQTLKSFRLDRHRSRRGYAEFMPVNIERAWTQLAETVTPKR